MPTLYLSTEPDADALLASDPLALLVGMLLDQQVPMERAFVAPYRLAQRLGTARLDAAAIAAYDPDALSEIFATPPSLHRFPGAMAARTQALCRVVADEYGGDAAAVWRGAATGPELVKRLGGLPGFGKQKAQIFAALLGKQLGVQPEGGRRRPARTGRRACTGRSRTSPTTPASPRSATTRSARRPPPRPPRADLWVTSAVTALTRLPDATKSCAVARSATADLLASRRWADLMGITPSPAPTEPGQPLPILRPPLLTRLLAWEQVAMGGRMGW